MLTDVTIEGLRGVGKVELKFVPDQRAYVLFGANGIGKTKCLEALYQFLLASNKDFAKDFMAKQIGLPCNASVMTHMSNVPDGGLYELPGGGRYKFLQAWKGEIQLHGSPVVFLGAGQRASVNGMARQSAGLGSFEVRRKKYFNEIFQALDSGQLRALGMKDDTRTWFVARAQSANPYQKSKDDRSVEIDAVLAILHEIDPHVDSKVLRIDGDGRVFLSVDGQERELGELSSGYAALVKMVQ
ncbi:MAG: ATP-binding protein, partial [Candidatus Accumulibacter sp.]|nr:ATP-binding protein [Accumulibacter sp.]